MRHTERSRDTKISFNLTRSARFHHLRESGKGFGVIPYGMNVDWDQDPSQTAVSNLRVDVGVEYPDEDGIIQVHGRDGHHAKSTSGIPDSSSFFRGRRFQKSSDEYRNPPSGY